MKGMKTKKSSKKGIELPVNTLVFLAVAVIVLLAAVAWFLTTFGPTAKQQADVQTLNNCCGRFAAIQCPTGTLAQNWPPAQNPPLCGWEDLNGNGVVDLGGANPEPYTLGELYTKVSGDTTPTDAKVRKQCNCPQ